jgi:signal transduction histidine kinase
MTEGLVVFSEGGRVEYCNPVGASICGTTPESTIGQNISFLCDAAIASGQTEAFAESISEIATTTVTDPSAIYVGNDRPESRHYALTTFPITMESGAFSGVLIRDVTEQWKLEQRQFGFVSIAAHELRTPLTAVMGFSELLQTRKPSQEKRAEWVGYINAESHRSAAVLDQILNVTRIQSGDIMLKLGAVDVQGVMADTLKDIAAIAPERVVMVDLSTDIPEFTGDGEKMKQVLLNLMSNAFKYSLDDASIEVSARFDQVSQSLRISVTDHGMGIAERDRPKLFTSFTRVRNEQTELIRGTGLGLYICKKLVEAMGGYIWFDSTLGEGSTFTFTLPAQPPVELQHVA